MNLATEMRSTSQKFAQELTKVRHRELELHRQMNARELARLMEEAPKVAARLIVGLPEFLKSVAPHHSSAYIVYRTGCKPYEHRYPDYESPRYMHGDLKQLSPYKVRRYLRGTIQHVARWGLNHGFRVGIGQVTESTVRRWEEQTCCGIPFPAYMPGMFKGYVPDNSDLLYFAW